MHADYPPPKFDALFDYQEKFSELAAATNDIAMAGSKYQLLNMSHFWGSWMDHSTQKVNEGFSDFFSFMDEGFARANRDMIELQNTEEFLAAQKSLVSSLARLRHSQKEVAEIFQSWSFTPKQSDVEELTKTVYELRREVRRLRNEQDAPGEEA